MPVCVAAALLVISWTTVTLSVADDDGPLTMKSNAVTRLDVAAKGDQSSSRHGGRAGQPHQMTQQLIDEVVDAHNKVRAQEGANNMELMTWNAFLASLAAGWAAQCQWEHGQPSLGAKPQYSVIGQNLYATTGSIINVTAAIVDAWYGEKRDYDYDRLFCPDDKMCGHYTQIVWATSRHVGCAYQRCQPLTGAFSTALYLVCNYGPAGNYVGAKPFTKGPACSKCGSGAGWCKERLCNAACRSAGDECSCAAHCHHCATLSRRSCTCECSDGWYGPDCTVLCEDKHQHCARSPGWPDASWCDRPYVRDQCLVMCKRCTAAALQDHETQCDRTVYGPSAYGRAAIATITSLIISLTACVTLMLI